MRNLCLILSYDGADFQGWQRQPSAPTVQASVEEALRRVTGERVALHGSGRTDAGVHALRQAANFKCESPIPVESLCRALNHALPPAVRVLEAREVAPQFDARRSALAKTYIYRMLTTPICPPFLARYVCHCPYALDYDAMARAARLLEGRHDFTSFAAAEGVNRLRRRAGLMAGKAPELSSPQLVHPDAAAVRSLFSSRMIRRKTTGMLVYRVRGSGFLQYMVRNIAGTLMEVGRGAMPPERIPEILAARDRRRAGPSAPPQGLWLVNVEYEWDGAGE